MIFPKNQLTQFLMQHVRHNPHPYLKKFLIGFARFTLMILLGSEGVRTPGPPGQLRHWERRGQTCPTQNIIFGTICRLTVTVPKVACLLMGRTCATFDYTVLSALLRSVNRIKRKSIICTVCTEYSIRCAFCSILGSVVLFAVSVFCVLCFLSLRRR